MNAQPSPSMPSPSIAIQFERLNKWYGDVHVLKDVNLDVYRKEIIVVCGPSGSGKSTLIRCINGLEPHQSGALRVALDGGEGTTSVGMVFQHFNLFPHLSVLDNCTIAPVSRGLMKPKEAREYAMHLLERVKMGHKAAMFPHHLSGGQQQRVAIARALTLKPQIMLFDEPTSALDPEMVKEVLDTMTDLADAGMTMLCVTHEMGFAKNVADRVVFMESGQVLEVSAAAGFFDQPAHPRAQAFLHQLRVH